VVEDAALAWLESLGYTMKSQGRAGIRELFRSKTSRNGAHNYTYGTVNRLVEALNPVLSNPQESYDYDPVGNRTNSNQNGASSFNQVNELTHDANFIYQYDNNANMSARPRTVAAPHPEPMQGGR